MQNDKTQIENLVINSINKSLYWYVYLSLSLSLSTRKRRFKPTLFLKKIPHNIAETQNSSTVNLSFW